MMELYFSGNRPLLIMTGKSTLVCMCATLCVAILIAEMVTAAPTYADYESK